MHELGDKEGERASTIIHVSNDAFWNIYNLAQAERQKAFLVTLHNHYVFDYSSTTEHPCVTWKT